MRVKLFLAIVLPALLITACAPSLTSEAASATATRSPQPIVDTPSLPASTTPTATPKSREQISQDSPFGIMAAFDPSTLTTIKVSDKSGWAGEKFRDLGAKRSRGGGEVVNWGLNEPEFGKGYNWSITDEFIKKAYQNGGENYNHVITITPIRAKGANSDIPLVLQRKVTGKNA